jgi:2-phosphosulfolactate phosphatase
VTFQAHYVSIEAASSITGGTAVVLDVLRAYTTAAWAFSLGAERIVLTDDIGEALALKALIPGALAMKDAEPLPGFELSNSPIELKAHDLSGRTIVQRTTHGTVGALSAKRAEHLYCASFLTAAATASVIRSSGATEVWFVVTGEDGLADEDLACAEYIAALVGQRPGLNPRATLEAGARNPGLNPGASHAVDPAPYLARVAASNAAHIMAKRVAAGTPGMHALDVEAAMDADRFDFVMMAREEHLDGFGPVLVLRAYNRGDD